MYQRSFSISKPIKEEGEASSSSSNVELTPVSRSRNLKWQLFFTVLRSSRAFQEILVENQDAFFDKFSRSASYTAIDVRSECFSAIDKSRLSELVRDQNRDHLDHFGGVGGLVSQLKTDPRQGIESDGEGISLRRRTFGSNRIRMGYPKMAWIVLATFKDPIMVLHFLFATLSLVYGIRREGLRGASDGLFIYGSITLVMIAASLANIWPARQFQALSESNNRSFTSVVRNGVKLPILANDVVVGDLVCLQVGDQVPADGLYVDGNSFRVNESVEINDDCHPFLQAGSRVTNGGARMLVTAVGNDTKWGGIVNSTRPTENKTPLQLKLHELTQNTAKTVGAVATVVLGILLIRYFTGSMKDSDGETDFTTKKSINQVFQAITGILAMPIVIATAAIPEGLLLAATITLAYSTKRMAADKVIVRNLAACEAMGSITAICIDRSGAVSSKSPQIEEFWLGPMKHNRRTPQMARTVLQLMHEGIGLNSACEPSSVLGELQTVNAICSWASRELEMNLEQLKENCSVIDDESLIQKKKGCVWIRRNDDEKVHIHMKGFMDEVLASCSHYYDKDGVIKLISEPLREKFMKNFKRMKDDGLDCIAYAHAEASGDLDDKCFTLIGCLGLKDLIRHNVSRVVEQCQKAGVCVKMITTEDVQKARISALRCGVVKLDQTQNTEDFIEGRDFRSFNEQEIPEKTKQYNVIASASPSDKLLLVRCLKQIGHVVGFIGGCLGDEKLFEEADVSFHLGTEESFFMKEKPDIIIAADSFDPIAKAIKWGRGIHNNIQIYAQFQLTATITSLLIDSVTTISAREPLTINIVTAISSGKIPFPALQLLWVKLIVGILVVLALSIDNPADNLMRKKPVDQHKPFITNIMWRDIIGQALCQIIILLTIQFVGESSFKLNPKEKDTLIFNITVLCQILTVFNTRKGKKVFDRLKNKRLFWMVIGVIILLQVVIVELLKKYAGTERLNWRQWQACIGIAAISWLIGWLLRRMPVPRKLYFCFFCCCIVEAAESTNCVCSVSLAEKPEN